MATLRKNQKAYDSADVVVSILGELESEVSDISYDEDTEHQLNYSLAGQATSWSMGKIKPEGSLTLYLNASRKLEDIAPDGRLAMIAPFDTTVTYVNEFNEIITDIVTWKFKKQGRKVNGEMGIGYQYEMFCLGIQFNKK